jgi:hypothetical protein
MKGNSWHITEILLIEIGIKYHKHSTKFAALVCEITSKIIKIVKSRVNKHIIDTFKQKRSNQIKLKCLHTYIHTQVNV